jgi:hypothetical protein
MPGVRGVISHSQKSQLGSWLGKFWTHFARRNCRPNCGLRATLLFVRNHLFGVRI